MKKGEREVEQAKHYDTTRRHKFVITLGDMGDCLLIGDTGKYQMGVSAKIFKHAEERMCAPHPYPPTVPQHFSFARAIARD